MTHTEQSMTQTEQSSTDAEQSMDAERSTDAEDGSPVGPDAMSEAAVLTDNLAEERAESAPGEQPSDAVERSDAFETGDAGEARETGIAGDTEDAADKTGDAGDDNPLEVEAEVAADYLEELLDIADLDGDIDTYVDGDRAHVSIVSDSNVLVGKNGEVLDALQELSRLAVLAETGQRSRLMLDVAGYRAKRRTELVALAGDAVQEVKDTAEPVHLAAMNPFERKVVHDAVAAAGLTSESEGEEPRRHVVVLPARG